MAKRAITPRLRKKAQHVKQLGVLDYTPQAARTITDILWALAGKAKTDQRMILTAFSRIVDEAEPFRYHSKQSP